MNLLRKLCKSQSGASIVEFAIVAPFLIFLAIGLIEVGRYMYIGILAAHAAEAGAQYATQSTTQPSDVNLTAAVDADGGGLTWKVHGTQFCELSGIVVNCPTTPTTGYAYYVTVHVSANFNSLLQYPGIPNTLEVTSQSTMRVASI